MLLMVEKGIREGIFHAINRYAKANNKYMKDYDTNKELSYLKYWDEIIYMVGQCRKKLAVNKFEWIEDTSKFNENFKKNIIKKKNEGDFLEVDIYYPEKLYELHNDLPSLPERMKFEKFEKLVTNLYD